MTRWATDAGGARRSVISWDQSTDRWRQEAPLPLTAGTIRHAVAAIGDKLYSVGGNVNAASADATVNTTDGLWEYQPARREWRQKASLPTTFHGHAVAVIGSKLYAAGGHDDDLWVGALQCTALYEWDQASNSWASKMSLPSWESHDPDVPVDHHFHAMASIGTKMYSLGAVWFATGPFFVRVNDPHALWEWDQATNVWTRASRVPLPAPATRESFAELALCAIGSKLYAIGGARDVLDPHEVAAENYLWTESYIEPVPWLWEWDQPSNTWTRKADVPEAGLAYHGAAAIGTKLYVVGAAGYGTTLTPPPEPAATPAALWEWDQATNTWSRRASMPVHRHMAKVAAIGTKLFVVGGKARFTTGVAPVDP